VIQNFGNRAANKAFLSVRFKVKSLGYGLHLMGRNQYSPAAR